MAPEYDRKLTAILHADVEGYSRLMRRDEESTVRTLSAYRDAMATLASQNNGRVIESTGDSVLAEFVSVVDAVRCAVAIQSDIKTRNAAVPEDRRLWFRIGVNLGDVIDEGDRIYGDGVNVASRVQELADTGGICITRPAYDQVKDKLSFQYDYIGEHSVKNMDEPVRVYRVVTELDVSTSTPIAKGSSVAKKVAIAAVVILLVGAVAAAFWFMNREPVHPRLTEVASVENMAYALPIEPSIAVLPFDNLSGDSADQYLADGLTENIITYLSHHPKLLVVSRNSTATYKGKAVKIKDVAEDLSVKYVLEGSIQRMGNRIRITIQLIDAITGYHRLSKQYDQDLGDFFALQDEIALDVLKTLQMTLVYHAPLKTDSLEAYKYVTQAYYGESGSIDGSIELARKATELDPDFVAAWATLCGFCIIKHAYRVQFGISTDEYLVRARDAANRAMAIDKNSPYAIGALALVRLQEDRPEEAIAMLREVIRVSPSNTDGHRILADALLRTGRYEEAVQSYKTAMRLDPTSNSVRNILKQLLAAYVFSEKFEKALDTYRLYLDHVERAGVVDPEPPFLMMSALHIWMNQAGQAGLYMEKALSTDPRLSLGGCTQLSFPLEPQPT